MDAETSGEAKGLIEVNRQAACEVCNARSVPVAALYRAGPIYPQIRVCADCLRAALLAVEGVGDGRTG